MRVSLQDGGIATIRIGPRTWVGLFVLLVSAAFGHYRIQSAKIDQLSLSLESIKARTQATEKMVADFRSDTRDSIRELRQDIASLNTFIRDEHLVITNKPAK
jgi:ribosomal protein L29